MSRNSWYIALGPLLGLLAALLCNRVSATYQASVIAGMTVWMCVWWFSECLSIAVTAWIPLLVMPLFGISGMSEVAHQYSDSIIFLFIGGFMLAFAIEKPVHQFLGRGHNASHQILPGDKLLPLWL